MENIILLPNGDLLKYDELTEIFEGKVSWMGKKIDVMLETDPLQDDSAKVAEGYFKILLDEMEEWDSNAKSYVFGYMQQTFPEVMDKAFDVKKGEGAEVYPELELILVSPSGEIQFMFKKGYAFEDKTILALGHIFSGFNMIQFERLSEK